MGEVTRLPTAAADTSVPNEALVDVLESLLEDARSGRLRGIAFAGLTSASFIMSGHVLDKGASLFTLLGGLHYVSAGIEREIQSVR